MAAQTPRRRKAAEPPKSKSVKTSLTLDMGLHSRLSAAASMAGMSNNAFVVEVLAEALKGLVIIDRRRNSGDVGSDSPEESAA